MPGTAERPRVAALATKGAADNFFVLAVPDSRVWIQVDEASLVVIAEREVTHRARLAHHGVVVGVRVAEAEAVSKLVRQGVGKV